MPTSKKSSSRGMLSTTSNVKVPAAKSKKTNTTKTTSKSSGKANTATVMGNALPGGNLGYTTAARKQVNKEIKEKKIKPADQKAYAEKRIKAITAQSKGERQRTATRAKYAKLDSMRSPGTGLRGKSAKEVGQKVRSKSVRQNSMYK